MISVAFSAEVVKMVLATGAIHERCKILDGIPEGHELCGARFEGDGGIGVLVLDFAEKVEMPQCKPITVKMIGNGMEE